MQWHVVVALVGGKPAKVECAHCHKQHQFRAAAPGSTAAAGPGTSPSASSTKAKTTRKAAPPPAPSASPSIDLAALTAGREAKGYDPQRAYVAGDVVRHPSFGVGVVMLLPGPYKIEVAFQAGQKLLAHDRAVAAGVPALARPSPTSGDPRAVPDAPSAPRPAPRVAPR
jgi:hypothetical protein